MARALSAPQFHNEEAAYAYVEARLWPHGPVCPHCAATGDKIGRLTGKTTRPGLRKCYACRKPFTVRMGTLFESSHVPLRVWLQTIYLICSSKKGISTRQIQRTIGGSMTTAWFIGHRIRLAMDPGSVGPLGGEGKTVEADETALTRSRKTKHTTGKRRRPYANVMSLVERGGNIRSLVLDHRSVMSHVYKHVDEKSRLVSDMAQHYKFPPVAKHETVDHSKYEFVRGDVHVNTLEGFFSIFKRGLIGVYQHVDQKHLDRYLAEFDFRQNNRAKLGVNDAQRADIALQGVKGKRLTYETTHRAQA